MERERMGWVRQFRPSPAVVILGLLLLASYGGEQLLRMGLGDPVQRALLMGNVRAAEAAMEAKMLAHGESAEALAAIGDFLVERGYTAEAMPYLNRSLAKDPNSPALVTLGMIAENQGRDAEAEERYREAARRRPDDPRSLNALGYFYAQRATHLDEAVALLQRALERAPTDPAIIDSMGWALYQRGDVDSAAEHLLAAADEMPGDAVVRFHLGVALAHLGGPGSRSEAHARGLVELGKAVLLDPKMPDARRIFQEVRAGSPPPLPVPWTQFRK